MILNDHFALPHFQGTLDFLLCLIRKEEIDIYDVPIYEIIQQFIAKLTQQKHEDLEKGAEFIGIASYLLWLKSKTLLPNDAQKVEFDETQEDPHFEIIHHLVDYCRFKKAAKELTARQDIHQGCYYRGVEAPEWKKPLGIDHVSLAELTLLFKGMMERTEKTKQQIHEENWKVSDKIQLIRHWVKESSSFNFSSLFAAAQSRLEIVVIFLAILELIKGGEITVGRTHDSLTLVIFAKKEENDQRT